MFEGETSALYSKAFRTVRNRLAKSMVDPSIKSIRLYDLRHELDFLKQLGIIDYKGFPDEDIS